MVFFRLHVMSVQHGLSFKMPLEGECFLLLPFFQRISTKILLKFLRYSKNLHKTVLKLSMMKSAKYLVGKWRVSTDFHLVATYLNNQIIWKQLVNACVFITQVLLCLSEWYHANAVLDRAGTVSTILHNILSGSVDCMVLDKNFQGSRAQFSQFITLLFIAFFSCWTVPLENIIRRQMRPLKLGHEL